MKPCQEERKIYRRVLFVVMAAALYMGYGILKSQQLHGQFLCDRIFIQFGDDFGTAFAAFSGVYSQTDKRVNQRVTYVEEKRKDAKGQAGRIGYCSADKAWKLYLDENAGPCEWKARSPETETFDVTSTSISGWLTEDKETEQTLAYSTFYMACVDCNDGLCRPSHGRCKENMCVCHPGRHGINCEFGAPCDALTIDIRTGKFPVLADGFIDPPESYELLRNDDDDIVIVYDKPVYTSNVSFFGYRYALFFTGRSYAVIVANETSTLRNLLLNPEKGYHSYFDSPVLSTEAYQFVFLSSPLDVGRSSHQLTPEGLGWYHSRGDPFLNRRGPVFAEGFIDAEAALLCATCDNNTNPCFNFQHCDVASNRCQCSDWFEGSLCEASPDCFDFNPDGDPDFNGCYDGGTCGSSGFCTCPSHSTGKYCEYHQDCSVAGCMDGGACDSSGQCMCPSSKNSSSPFDYCARNGNCVLAGCSNGGNCAASSGICSCSPEYYGPFCADKWDHSCPPEYYGPGCADKWDCDLVVCEGGGTCDPSGSCVCPYNQGRLCEKSLDCSRHGCMDGGICNTDSEECGCPSNVTETLFYSTSGNCADLGCSNGGVCTASGACGCPFGYSGAFCEMQSS